MFPVWRIDAVVASFGPIPPPQRGSTAPAAILCELAQPLQGIRLRSAFLLRSVEPDLPSFAGHEVTDLRRLGKRVVFGFPDGSLLLTEAGSTKRAWLRAVDGAAALAQLDPGGIEPLTSTFEQFVEALSRENRTLKRALTDARILSGIGNAYSDEILHMAQLSPLQRTRNLEPPEARRLFDATVQTLTRWRDDLCAEAQRAFPKRVTAFRQEMAVHGRYQEPCPVCGNPVQRLVYASNEANYCARCQTDGRLLADRALSRLLKDDWPGHIEDLDPG